MKYEEFFYQEGQARPKIRHDDINCDTNSQCSIEELYQHFKARLMDEVVAIDDNTNMIADAPILLKDKEVDNEIL
jgi:hypothetical protein